MHCFPPQWLCGENVEPFLCYYTAGRFRRIPSGLPICQFSTNKTMGIHKPCTFINISASVSPITSHTCWVECMKWRVRVWTCKRGYLHVFCFFCLCVQQSPNQIQQKVFVYSCFPPLWFTLILIPIWGLILVCCLGWDSNFSEAWQEGRKPLALLLACHWCMPLGTMCHILQLAHAAFFFFSFFPFLFFFFWKSIQTMQCK